jgi:hypothetical protein
MIKYHSDIGRTMIHREERSVVNTVFHNTPRFTVVKNLAIQTRNMGFCCCKL